MIPGRGRHELLQLLMIDTEPAGHRLHRFPLPVQHQPAHIQLALGSLVDEGDRCVGAVDGHGGIDEVAGEGAEGAVDLVGVDPVPDAEGFDGVEPGVGVAFEVLERGVDDDSGDDDLGAVVAEEVGVETAQGRGVGVAVTAEEHDPVFGVGRHIAAQVLKHPRGDRGDERGVVIEEYRVGLVDGGSLSGCEVEGGVEGVASGRTRLVPAGGVQAGHLLLVVGAPSGDVASAGVAGLRTWRSQVMNAG